MIDASVIRNTTINNELWNKSEARELKLLGEDCLNSPSNKGWQMGELGHKWIECIITYLSIYDPFIYKLIIHYQSNPFN